MTLDAEGICEAVTRPSMRSVPIKSIEQQDIQCLHRIRSRLVQERTALANQIRGLLAEYSVVVAQGISKLRKQLPLILEDESSGLTSLGREMFQELYQHIIESDQKVAHADARIEKLSQQDEGFCRKWIKSNIGMF